MTRNQIVLNLQQDYAKRREANQIAFEYKVQDACEQCEGLRELVVGRRDALINGIKGGILSDAKNPNANMTLSERMADYNARIAECLERNGLPKDHLQPIYTCSICRDEGFVYEPTRHMCSCFETELNRRMFAEMGLDLEHPQSFENYDETLFSDETIPPHNISQRQMMARNRKVCEEYADTFPNTQTRDMLFIGKSGLGKTYLLQSIAYRVSGRGIFPAYMSAYRLFEIFRKAYLENEYNELNALIAEPLLLIDDLGTEPLMNNITVSSFLNLLDERQRAGRHTVINTNLEMTEIRDRYTERVASRLLDSKDCKRLTFIGEDLRKKVKRNG